uniref:CCHC-type domain-containing protein n=1 Tax=Oreochromis aureus TaxID=47969 RepID=A0AAZ1XRN0_OREAU
MSSRPSPRHSRGDSGNGTPLIRRRPRRPTDRCYRCNEPGHVAHDCPAPAPKTRTMQPQGNGE